MAQRLRLYFGSGRSNTAPDILEETSVEQPTQDKSPSENSTDRTSCYYEPTLKRSSSMFIPQLSTHSETRPTKSSSVHISLQRANGINNGESNCPADDTPPPSYRPPSPAPAYSETQNHDVPLYPPPPYYIPDAKSSTGSNEVNLPKRRVFSIGSNGNTLYSRGNPSISVGGICIQRKSPDGSDVQQVRILPYGGAGWYVQQQKIDHSSAANEEPQRLVFQLNQSRSDNQDGQQESLAHVTTVKGNRIVCYPRIRLERSSSYPRLHQHQKTIGGNQEVQTEPELTETRNKANGCVLNLCADSPQSKPRFKIFFNSGGGDDTNAMVGPTRNDVKVKIVFGKWILLPQTCYII